MSDPGFVLVKPLPLYLCGVDKCPVTFPNRKSLVYHRRCSHGIRPVYKCPECSKEFRYRSWLASHYLVHIMGPKKKEKCPVCSALFLHRRSLLRHCKEFKHGPFE